MHFLTRINHTNCVLFWVPHMTTFGKDCAFKDMHDHWWFRNQISCSSPFSSANVIHVWLFSIMDLHGFCLWFISIRHWAALYNFSFSFFWLLGINLSEHGYLKCCLQKKTSAMLSSHWVTWCGRPNGPCAMEYVFSVSFVILFSSILYLEKN